MLPAAQIGQQQLARRQLARRYFVWYVRLCFPRMTLGRWQIDLCQRLQDFHDAVERGESPCLMIWAPPQNGKSMLISRAFQAWILGKHPDWPLILCSYASSLSVGHGRWVRDRIKSVMHRKVFPDSVMKEDSQAVGEFRMEAGGQMICQGVTGGTTGQSARIFTVDDPFSDRAAAESPVIREGVWDWYSSVATNRMWPGGGKLIMHTRWHVADLCGRLLEMSAADPTADQWKVASYPAIAVAGDMLGRKPGEPLHPERYSYAELMRKRASMTPRDWHSIQQQNPIVATGGFFEIGKINRLRNVPTPKLDRVYIGADLALTPEQQGRGDYSVFVAGGIDYLKRRWIIDIIRGRWAPAECAKRMINFALLHEARMVWIENGPSFLGIQPSIVNHMQQTGDAVPFQSVTHGGKAKDVRAIPFQGSVNAGLVYVPWDAPWWRDFSEELERFPGGKNDDQVDAASYLFTYMHRLPIDDKPLTNKPLTPAEQRSKEARESYKKAIDKHMAGRKPETKSEWDY